MLCHRHWPVIILGTTIMCRLVGCLCRALPSCSMTTLVVVVAGAGCHTKVPNPCPVVNQSSGSRKIGYKPLAATIIAKGKAWWSTQEQHFDEAE
jgi:hypothetical protein